MSANGLPKIQPEVEEKLGYYVYAYVDPRNQRPFYIGKGKAGRVLSHLTVEAENQKGALIEEIKSAGMKPQLDIIQHGLPDEDTALRIEAALIDTLGLQLLTNEVYGWRRKFLGRSPLSELVAEYAAKPVEVTDAAILIRINQRYYPGMSDEDVYEAIRGIWKVGSRTSKAKLALAVFGGVVRGVYEIETWHPAGTTAYRSRTFTPEKCRSRWEFVGHRVDDRIRERYMYGSVFNYLPGKARTPLGYVNC
jgi:hypothetical protein